MGADINNLGLVPEAFPEVDWNAPEAGSFPPELKPGIYTFLFFLPEAATELFKMSTAQDGRGKAFAELGFEAEALSNGAGEPVAPHEDGKQPRLRYQRATTGLWGKMTIHGVAELARSLGLKVEPPTKENLEAAFKEASGRKTFRGEVGWRCYFKASDTTVSTHARTKKGEIKWPRNTDGSYQEAVSDPTTGEKAFGRAEIVRFKLPDTTH